VLNIGPARTFGELMNDYGNKRQGRIEKAARAVRGELSQNITHEEDDEGKTKGFLDKVKKVFGVGEGGTADRFSKSLSESKENAKRKKKQ
jgi:hypothetical protein